MLALPLIFVALTFVLVLASPERLNHDSALYLQCAELLLQGKRPYLDFVEINPPFVFYLHVIPVLLSRVLRLPLALSFSLLVATLSAWSALMVSRLMARSEAWRPLGMATASVWALYTFFYHGSGSFGQREHLIMLLYLPYLVDRSSRAGATPGTDAAGIEGEAPRPRSGLGRIPWLGLAAGCALCIKPQFVPVAAVLELFWLVLGRRLRRLRDPELLAMAAVPAAYALHFALLPGAVRDAFFGRWLPLIAARYCVYDSEFVRVLRSVPPLPLVLGVVAVATARWWPPRSRALVASLGLFVLGAIAVYLAQRKAWDYQRMPFFATTAVLVTWMAERVANGAMLPLGAARSGRLAGIAGTMVIPIAAGIAWCVNAQLLPLPIVDPIATISPLEQIVYRYSAPGEPVLVISPSVPSAYPLLVRTERRPASRYLWTFPIPMVALGGEAGMQRTPEQIRSAANGSWLRAQEARFLQDLREDYRASRPPVVLIPTGAQVQGCQPGFRVLDYLAAVGLLGEIARDHDRLEDAQGFAVYVARDRLGRPAL